MHFRPVSIFFVIFTFSFLNTLAAQIDITPVSLKSPISSVICRNVNDPVQVVFRSNSTDQIDFSQTPLKVTVTISGAKTGVLTGEINSGFIYTTDNFIIGVSSAPAFTFDVIGNYIFKIKTSLAGDTNLANDEITVTRTINVPLSIPFFEDLNSTNVVEWRFDENPQYQCNTSAIVEEGGNKFVRCSQYDCGYAIFTLPQIGQVRAGDALSFDYRILNNYFPSGRLSAATSGFNYISVQASTDCGRTFTEFHRINPADHVANDIFVKKTIPLPNFIGQDIKIRFVTNTVAGDIFNRIFLEFDNFSVGTGVLRDAGVIHLENLDGQCDNPAQAIKIKIKNFGVQTIDFGATPTTVTAKVTGATTAILTKILNTGTLAPEGNLDLMLDGFFNMSALNSVYNIAIFTNLPNDAVVNNDTLKRSVTSPAVASPAARALPFTENFDTSPNIPAGWLTGYSNFGRWAISQNTGNSSNSLFKDASNDIEQDLVSPRVGAIRATDRLSLDIKITNKNNPSGIAIADWGKCLIQVSDDCGYSYQPILVIDGNNLKTGEWRTFVAPLSNFANQNILIKIQTEQSSTNPVYRIDLDNFSITPSPSLDMGVMGLVNPQGNCTNATQAITVKIKNFASLNINFATNPTTVAAVISGSANTILSKIVNTGILAAGETLDVALNGVVNMATLGDYFIKPTVSVANDGLRSNDSIFTVKRTVRAQFNTPYTENFDDQTTFPQGWIVNDWAVNSSLENAARKYLAVTMATKTQSEVYLPIFKTVAEDEFLLFRYNFGAGVSGDFTGVDVNVVFEASSDCGVSFQEIYVLNNANVDFNQTWKSARIPLRIFKGNPIAIRIKTKKQNDYNWLFAIDDIRIDAIKPIDVSCDTAFLNPVAPSSCGNSTRYLEVRLTNRGSKDVDFSKNPATIMVKMSGQGSKILTKHLTSNILYTGTFQDILIEDPINTVDAGVYKFDAIVSTQGDVVLKNDTCKQVAIMVNPPYSKLPYRQNFDTIGLPKGWALDRWDIFDTDGVQNSRCAVFQAIAPSFSGKALTSPLIGKISEGDRIYFDYRIWTLENGNLTAAPAGWGAFKIQVSTICGDSYVDILTISDDNHVVSTEWATKSISLSAFKGNNIVFRIVPFVGSTAYNLSIDNVFIGHSEAVDIAPIKLLSPLINCGFAEQIIAAEVRNLGTTTLNFNRNPLTVKAIFTGRINETLFKTIVTDSLQSDKTLSIIFEKKLNTLAEGTYNLKIVTEIAGDGNRNNDTIGNFTEQVSKTHPVPFIQNFDNIAENPITNWQAADWIVQPFNSQSAGNVIFATFTDETILTLPKLGIIRANDALDFDYYLGGGAVFQNSGNFTIEVDISEDCGGTYSSADSRRIFYNASNEIPGWRHFNVLLTEYIGKAITIRFKIRGFNGSQNEISFDNVILNNIRQKDVSPTIFFNGDYPPYCGNVKSKWYGTVTNSGNETIDFALNPLTVTAVFKGTTISTQTKKIETGTLVPRANIQVEFELDMSRLGVYYSNLITSMAGDINPLNDTSLTGMLDTRGAPLPFSEDFEGLSIKYSFTGDTWSIMQGNGINDGRGMRKGFNADAPTGYLNMPQIGTIRTNDALSFDMKLTDLAGQPLTGNWGKIKISVSTDCERSFTEIHTIDGSLWNFSNWSYTSIPLSNFVGKSIVVRFDVSYLPNVSGFYVYFDNFTIKTNTEAPLNDDCATAINLNQFPNGHQSTTERATGSTINSPTCATTAVNDIWYKIITPNDIQLLSRMNVVLDNIVSGTVINFAIYKGSCEIIRQLDSTGLCGSTTIGTTLALKNLELGQTYYLRLWSKNVAESGKFNVRLANGFPFANLSIANPNTPICRPLSIIHIRQENNNVWVPIMDGNDIVAAIKANGNNLGRVQTDYFINKTGTIRKSANVPFLDRNIGFKPDTQPRIPVSIRFFLTAVEWQALRNADPSVSDSTFSLTRVSNQTCTSSFTAATGSQITGAFLFPFNGGYYIQFNTPQFSQFFIHNIKAALKLSTATADLVSEKIQVYPIPTEGTLNVSIETLNAETIKLELIDFIGRVLKMETHQSAIGVNAFALDLTHQPSGSYFLMVTTPHGKWMKKIVK